MKASAPSNFKSISDAQLDLAEYEEIRKWTEVLIDCDNKFVNEFQLTFDSSLRELYLHATFQELRSLHDQPSGNVLLGNAVSPGDTPGSVLTRAIFPLNRHVPR